MSIGQGELCDEVHGDSLERQARSAGDQVQGGLCWVSVDFIYLADCAAFDIVGYKVFHAGPPVEGLDELDGFGNSRVSGGYGRVKMVKYTPPKIVVFHNNEGGALP